MRRWICCLLAVLLAAGCATKRTITIGTDPEDGIIKIDGVDYGHGPITHTFEFKNRNDEFVVTAGGFGYATETETITRDRKDKQLLLKLGPHHRTIYIQVQPHPAVISLNGEPLSPAQAMGATTDVKFPLDARGNLTEHTITAELDGFEVAKQTVRFRDVSDKYTLTLEPKKKDLLIRTNPEGAEVTLDDQPLGISPATRPAVEFAYDVESSAYARRTIEVIKPGYDSQSFDISWDEGQNEYEFVLNPKQKDVRIITYPPNSTVTLDGEPKTERDERGRVIIRGLTFPPVNENGDLKEYVLGVSFAAGAGGKKAEYYPHTQPLRWDDGKDEEIVQLREIITREVPLTVFTMQQSADGGWQPVARSIETIAMKDTGEGPLRSAPLPVIKAADGTYIDSVVASPDGSRLVYNVLLGAGGGADANDLGGVRSQIRMVYPPPGKSGEELLTDGRTFDVTPSFTPDGDHVVFSSNRATPKMSIWEISASGDEPGITKLTSGESTHDLWPVVDSDPRPRLFYQGFVDNRADSKLFMAPYGGGLKLTELVASGSQPRVNPRGDLIVFTGVNAKTGKRDLYLMPPTGWPKNITNTPDLDEHSPVWNRDGTRIAFAGDLALEDEEKRRNYDIWTIDVKKPDKPTQITTNGSWDDQPAWDASGNFIYFRSNRGGQWGIWRIEIAGGQ